MIGHDVLRFVEDAPDPMQRDLAAIAFKGATQSIPSFAADELEILGTEDMRDSFGGTFAPTDGPQEKDRRGRGAMLNRDG